MRILEVEQIVEVFTPQIEGWYDIDDIRIWLNNNYGPKSAQAWDSINSQLVTTLPDIQAGNLVDRYKSKDIEIMNDFLDKDFPFECIDLQYFRGKAVWKCAPTRPADIE